MQKILVGLCTLFLLTVIIYKYSKDKQQDGFLWWFGRKKHSKTKCGNCKKKCKARHFISKNKTITADSHPKAQKCVVDCGEDCIKPS
jgi:hypothetical protein